MTTAARTVFLFDVDNTLLDNDRVHADLDRRIARDFGADGARRYWALYEGLRAKLGYADYLGAIQQFRLECGDEVRAQTLAAFLLDYPFADRLYPGALAAIAHAGRFATCVVLSDGDAVLQPRKIAASGIEGAVHDNVLVYVHKERMLDDVERRFPAGHYVMVDDKLRVLAAMRSRWRDRLTTVFVRQGHYASDPAERDGVPAAQVELDHIGALCGLVAGAFIPASEPATATE